MNKWQKRVNDDKTHDWDFQSLVIQNTNTIQYNNTIYNNTIILIFLLPPSTILQCFINNVKFRWILFGEKFCDRNKFTGRKSMSKQKS